LAFFGTPGIEPSWGTPSGASTTTGRHASHPLPETGDDDVAAQSDAGAPEGPSLGATGTTSGTTATTDVATQPTKFPETSLVGVASRDEVRAALGDTEGDLQDLALRLSTPLDKLSELLRNGVPSDLDVDAETRAKGDLALLTDPKKLEALEKLLADRLGEAGGSKLEPGQEKLLRQMQENVRFALTEVRRKERLQADGDRIGHPDERRTASAGKPSSGKKSTEAKGPLGDGTASTNKSPSLADRILKGAKDAWTWLSNRWNGAASEPKGPKDEEKRESIASAAGAGFGPSKNGGGPSSSRGNDSRTPARTPSASPVVETGRDSGASASGPSGGSSDVTKNGAHTTSGGAGMGPEDPGGTVGAPGIAGNGSHGGAGFGSVAHGTVGGTTPSLSLPLGGSKVTFGRSPSAPPSRGPASTLHIGSASGSRGHGDATEPDAAAESPTVRDVVTTFPRRPASGGSGVTNGGAGPAPDAYAALPPIPLAPPSGSLQPENAPKAPPSRAPVGATGGGSFGTLVRPSNASDGGIAGSSGGSILASTGPAEPPRLSGPPSEKPADVPRINLLTNNDFAASAGTSGSSKSSPPSAKDSVPLAAGTGAASGPLTWKNEPPVANGPGGNGGPTAATAATATVGSANGTPWTDSAASDERRLERAAASATRPLVSSAKTTEPLVESEAPPANATASASKIPPPKPIGGELADAESDTDAAEKTLRVTALAARADEAKPVAPLPMTTKGPKSRTATKPAYKAPVVAVAETVVTVPPKAPTPLTLGGRAAMAVLVPLPAATNAAGGSDLARFRQNAPRK
jgi:hypothetical protein